MRIQTYQEFWPFYLGQHAERATRGFHFVGTTGALIQFALGAVTFNPWYFLTGVLFGYACAWISHFFIEKNRPATFQYPWWSFISDFKMWGYTVTGKIAPELKRLGVVPRKDQEAVSA